MFTSTAPTRSLIPALCLALLATACGRGGDNNVTPEDMAPEVDMATGTTPEADMSSPAEDMEGGEDMAPDMMEAEPVSLGGVAQKGPYLEGALMEAIAVSDAGEIGDVLGSGSVDDAGVYDITFVPSGAQVLLQVSGAVFDESTGEGSATDYSLAALAILGENLPNAINLYTDLVAYRALTLMREGQAVSDAKQTARDELATLLGEAIVPGELDIITGGEDEENSAVLRLYSAAFFEAGKEQEQWELVRQDFADDGLLDGDGWQEHQDILDAARGGGRELYERAGDNLTAAYPDTQGFDPPQRDTVFGRCLTSYLYVTDNIILCEGIYAEFSPAGGSNMRGELLVEDTGHYLYTFYHSAEASCTGGFYSVDGQEGAFSTGNLDEVVTFVPHTAGTDVEVKVSTACRDGIVVGVEATRVSDGSKASPVELIKGRTRRGALVLASSVPSGRFAYYKIVEAVDTLAVSGYALGDDGVRVRVFDPDQGGFDGEPIVDQAADGSPQLTLELPLKGGLLVQVEGLNQSGGISPESFTIRAY